MKEKKSYIGIASLIVAIIVLLFGNNIIERFFRGGNEGYSEVVENPIEKAPIQSEQKNKENNGIEVLEKENQQSETIKFTEENDDLSEEEKPKPLNSDNPPKFNQNGKEEESIKKENNINTPETNSAIDPQEIIEDVPTNNCQYRIDSRTATNIPAFRAPNKNSEIKFKLPHAQNVFLIDSMVYGNNEVYYQITIDNKTGWVRKKNIKTNCN